MRGLPVFVPLIPKGLHGEATEKHILRAQQATVKLILKHRFRLQCLSIRRSDENARVVEMFCIIIRICI